jgi:hypothetical protein
MIPGALAIPLSLLPPAAALGFAIRAFKRRSWRTYRNFAMASTLSSLFTLVVILYVVFLGRSGGMHEAMGRMRLGLCCGGIPIFTLTVTLISLALGMLLIGRRTDDGRPEPTVGRPMLAVFSVLLLTLLGVATVIIEIRGRS